MSLGIENQPLIQQEPRIIKDHNFLFTKLTLLISGIYKKTSKIENPDISPYITENTRAELIIQRLDAYLQRRPNATLAKIAFHITGRSFILGGGCLFCDNMLNMIAVQLLNHITDLLENYKNSKNYTPILLFMGLMTVCYLLKCYLQIKWDWISLRWKAEIKTTLQYIVYKKALVTKQFSSKSGQSKKGSTDDADINNLMTVDVDETLNLAWSFHCLWVSMITLFIILYLLYLQIGDAVTQGIYIFVIAFVFNIVISVVIQQAFRRMLTHKDKRVSLTTDIIEGMKSIKYLCWERIFEKKIMEVRRKEYNMLWIQRGMDGVAAVFWNSISSFLLYSFLTTYISQGHKLQDSNVFVIIALFNMMTFPIGVIPWAINQQYKCYVSYRRIRQFILEKEINPDEIESQPPNESQIRIENTHFKQCAIEINKMVFRWPKRSSAEQSKPEKTEKKKDHQQLSEESEKAEEFELRINNFNVIQGELTFLIGKIGSGKTALLNAIMNEMENIFGKSDNTNYSMISNEETANIRLKTMISRDTIVRGSTAVVTQNHWLQNQSIRDNILFGKPYDRELYRNCIQICQLEHDLETFTNRDMKLVGPQGSKLSGGQKQRICLARALYQDRDIYLFDDIFSSLDAHVADAVFEKAILGYLNKKKKTVLFVTSHYKYLKFSENIVFMEDGAIVHDKEKLQSYLQKEIEEQMQKEHEVEEYKSKNLHVEDELLDDQALELKKKLSSKKKSKGLKENQGEQDEDSDEDIIEANEEYRDQGKLKMETLKTYFRAMNWILFANFIIWNFLMQFGRSFIDFWLKDQVTPGSTFFNFINNLFHNDFNEIFTFLILVSISITVIRNVFYVVCSQLAAFDLFKKLNTAIIYSNMKFFDSNAQGRIVNRVSNDVLMIDDELAWFFHVFLENFASCVGIPIGIAISLPAMVVPVLFCIFLIYLFSMWFRPANREIKRLQSVNEGKVLSLIGEVCKGTQIIRAFSKQSFMTAEYIKRMNDAVSTWVVSSSIFLWMESRLLLVGNLIIISVNLVAISLLVFHIDFEYTAISFAMTYAIIISSDFCDFVYFLCGTEQRLVSVERIRQYYTMNTLEDLSDAPNLDQQQQWQINSLTNNNNPEQKQEGSKSENSIAFKNVTLSYDEPGTPNMHFAISNLSLEIKRGEKIAFCGRTGSGKTSILNILFKMYPIFSGEVYVNGVETGSMSLQNLRQQMSIIPQFGFLYNQSLKENLDPENKHDKEHIQHVIQSSGLNIRKNQQSKNSPKQSENSEIGKENGSADYNQIDTEKEKIIDVDFEIEDSGNNLSNGEKQIINFLRVILRDQNIICLDEATSNMDPKTDKLLHDKLFEFAEGKTLLVITHRLENIDKFDRVVVLDKGQIVEIGHVSELRRNENGFFNRLLKV